MDHQVDLEEVYQEDVVNQTQEVKSLQEVLVVVLALEVEVEQAQEEQKHQEQRLKQVEVEQEDQGLDVIYGLK